MKMLRRTAWGHDWIDTSTAKLAKAQVTEEGVGWSDVEEERDEQENVSDAKTVQLGLVIRHYRDCQR